MTKVSVIIPAYNVENYIETCLISLINQTFNDFEIIVVIDGATDNTEKVVQNLIANNTKTNMKYFVKENGGAASARNFGINKAIGDYLIFIDGDDYVSNNMIEVLYNHAVLTHSDIVQCNIIKFDNNSLTNIPVKHFSENSVKNYVLSHPSACDKIFSRKLFENIIFDENNYYEDLNLIPLLIVQTKNISFVDDYLYYYRQHENAKSGKKKYFDSRLNDIFVTLENIKTNLNKLEVYNSEIEYLYITHLLRSATLRYLDYDNTTEELEKINKIMKDEFPNWSNNIYFAKSSLKLKLICKFAYNKNYKILKLIKKVTNK